MNHRLINYLVGIYLFFYYVLWSVPPEGTWLLVAFILALAVSGVGLTLNWFSIDGAFSSLMIGTAALGLGQWTGAVSLLIFVFGSYLCAYLLQSQSSSNLQERRTGRQIWSNGFWFTLGIILWSFTGELVWLVAAVGSITAAAADTMGTITGSRAQNSNVVSILNFKQVPPGTDGGVSITGTFAALLISIVMGIAALFLLPEFNTLFPVIIIIAGFSGCIVDSYFGAIFQYANRAIRLPWYKSHGFYFTNNRVNIVATGWGALLSLLLYQMI